MFIAWYLRSPRRGSEGRNETGLVLVKLISAPPNRAGGGWAFSAINMSLLRSETTPPYPPTPENSGLLEISLLKFLHKSFIFD